MSQASDLGEIAKTAKAVYELIGASGASYVIFWFPDHSVIAARRLPSPNNQASAHFTFGVNTKDVLDDCGMSDFEGTTYQKGRELLKRIEQ